LRVPNPSSDRLVDRSIDTSCSDALVETLDLMETVIHSLEIVATKIGRRLSCSPLSTRWQGVMSRWSPLDLVLQLLLLFIANMAYRPGALILTCFNHCMCDLRLFSIHLLSVVVRQAMELWAVTFRSKSAGHRLREIYTISYTCLIQPCRIKC
jgi:hypothetical protein